MKESLWNGYRRIDFEFMEREAILVFPDECNKTDKWVFKTEYFTAFQNLELKLVEMGYHLAFISANSRWAPDEEIDVKAAFATYLHENYGLREGCVTVGMSCGGLQAARLAERHPSKVSVLYMDAPVLNILSQAGLGEKEFDKKTWEELKNTYGFSRNTLVNFRESPIDHMDVLLEHHIPVLLLYGNADPVVIYSENGKVLEDYYKKNGGVIKVICRSSQGHHPHGLQDPTPLVEFIEKNY